MVVVPSYEQCAKACKLIFDPVCGRSANGQTQVFGNRCVLDAEICNNPGTGNFKLHKITRFC